MFLTDSLQKCSKITFNIFQYANKNIPGLAMLFEFEKAFDPVSIKFIYQDLNPFDFGIFLKCVLKYYWATQKLPL